jgi:hypothetical protein
LHLPHDNDELLILCSLIDTHGPIAS